MRSTDEMAQALWAADRRRAPVTPLTDDLPELSIEDAYAIQRAGLELRLAAGASLVGHKVGLTSKAMQDMLGVSRPDFGYLTDDMVSDSGRVLSAGAFIEPRVEVEVAFRLRAPLRGPDVTVDDVLAATDAVAPALEVIDSRIRDWRITIADTIADNASCGHVVVGEWRAVDGVDLAAIEAELGVRDGDGSERTVSGRGDAVLGHPARAVAWLARALDQYDGRGLGSGEVILPGAMARALPVAAAADVQAMVAELGEVSVTFEGVG